jgi:elongation factor Ts
MKISAADVKVLRDLTNAGMMDCKKALLESQGDIEKAKLLLQEKGKSKADSKSGRVASQGLVSIEIDETNKLAIVLEINCETDFAAKDNHFIEFTEQISKLLISKNIDTVKKLMDIPIEGYKNVDEYRTHVVAKLGENINVRRFKRIFFEGTVGTYMHGTKIAALVDLDTDNTGLAKDLAMQIAALKPEYIDQGDIPDAMIEEELRILRLQAQKEGKPKEILEKIVNGKLNKRLNEITLLGQEYIKDSDLNISQLLKKSNANVNLFVRYEVGDGIDQEEKNFAEEVKAQVDASE